MNAPSPQAERLAEALVRAQAGDVSAMDDIVRTLNPLLWHVARSQGVARDEVADVVQHTWLELVRRLSSIDNPTALTAWLVTTTRRAAWRAASRSRRSDPVADVPERVDEETPAVERLLTDERDRALWTHFGQLSERCRRLLRLVALAERPDYRSVSESLGMPHGSIGPTRARCLARLRELVLADPVWASS